MEQGVPQGGVLSTTLFSIKINDIVKCLGNLTDCSLFVINLLVILITTLHFSEIIF